MKRSLIFITCLHFFLVSVTYSQKMPFETKKEKKYLKQMEVVLKQIHTNFKPRREDYEGLCIASVCFAQFWVNEEGLIKKLLFSKSTPLSLKKDLEKAIYSSNGFWPKQKKKKCEKISYLMPLAFSFASGCKERNSIDEKFEFKNPFLEILEMENNKYLMNTQCIILGYSIISL